MNKISPREQVAKGTLLNEIECKENFNLIFKSNTGLPACVSPSTSEELVKRNWATSVPTNGVVIFMTDKTEYVIGENITITMKNIGLSKIETPTIPVGFTIKDTDGNKICSWNGIFEAIGFFHTGDQIEQIWDQKYCLDDNKAQVKVGKYVIVGDHFYRDQIAKVPTHSINITRQ